MYIYKVMFLQMECSWSSCQKNPTVIVSVVVWLPPAGEPEDSWADLGESALSGGPRHLARWQEDSAAGWGMTWSWFIYFFSCVGCCAGYSTGWPRG